MSTDGYRKALTELLARAGIGVNGKQPWDIRVVDSRMFHRVLASGSLGAGESYMDGWWDCAQLDEMFRRFFTLQLDEQMPSWRQILATARARLFNVQSPE